MVLTEAAAVGLPIVASDVGGVEEWAIAILDLLADTERRTAYRRASRALAERDFSLEVMRSRLETAFESCFADAANSLTGTDRLRPAKSTVG